MKNSFRPQITQTNSIFIFSKPINEKSDSTVLLHEKIKDKASQKFINRGYASYNQPHASPNNSHLDVFCTSALKVLSVWYFLSNSINSRSKSSIYSSVNVTKSVSRCSSRVIEILTNHFLRVEVEVQGVQKSK